MLIVDAGGCGQSGEKDDVDELLRHGGLVVALPSHDASTPNRSGFWRQIFYVSL